MTSACYWHWVLLPTTQCCRCVVVHVLSRGRVRLHDCVDISALHGAVSSRIVLPSRVHISHRGVVPSGVLLPRRICQRHVEPLCARSIQRGRLCCLYPLSRRPVRQHVAAAVQSVHRCMPTGLLLSVGLCIVLDESVPGGLLLPCRLDRWHAKHGTGRVLRSSWHGCTKRISLRCWPVLHRCGTGAVSGFAFACGRVGCVSDGFPGDCVLCGIVALIRWHGKLYTVSSRAIWCATVGADQCYMQWHLQSRILLSSRILQHVGDTVVHT